MIDGGEVAEAARQIPRRDGRFAVLGLAGWDIKGTMTAALFFWEQLDKSRFQGAGSSAGPQFPGAARSQDLAGVHRHQPVETLRFLHVGGGYQYAHAFAACADAFDELPELAPREGVDAGGGLVEDQQVWIVDQRTAKPEFLLHATGEFFRRTVPKRRQTGRCEQFVDAPCTLLTRMAEQAAEEIDVLDDRQRRVEIPAQALGHIGDAWTGRGAVSAIRHVAAQHLDGAGLDLAHAGNEGQQA